KNIYRTISFIMALCILICSCSDDDKEAHHSQSYARFLQEEIVITASAGEITVLVEWSSTPWEISMDTDNGIITGISPVQGGDSESHQQITKIKIQYSDNPTSTPRVQDLFLTNKATQECSKLTIEQITLYTTLSVTLYPTVKYQSVVGFGGMYNPIIWLRNDLITDKELTKMYSNEELGYNILRLMIYPQEADWVADVQGAKVAQQHGALIFASPWDCTDALAEEIDINGKKYKHLKKENYQAYADHLVKYINYMKSKGVNLYAISVQNEPDMEFTYWYPQEVVDFVKIHGEQIRETGVKLMAPEACGIQPEYTDPILNDPVAFERTDIVARHLYQGFTDLTSSYVKNRHDYICGLYYSKLAGAGKTWWMTEKLFNEGEKEADPALLKFNQWSYNLETLEKEIHMCMEGYCSAYIYWYLKRFYGMIGDTDSRCAVEPGEVMKNGYILSHYARYASGMTRIQAETGNADPYVTAYINEAGTEITLVLLNLKNEAYHTQVIIPETIHMATAIETTEDKNMAPIETDILEGNTLSLLLSPSSIVSVKLMLDK
ncbi:MAG: hypothetical protein LUD15_10270, partial [Bacteroides sp.]|nr:hypothetical protein [Bacteroides sp.]